MKFSEIFLKKSQETTYLENYKVFSSYLAEDKTANPANTLTEPHYINENFKFCENY